jgi:hypothetical protein
MSEKTSEGKRNKQIIAMIFLGAVFILIYLAYFFVFRKFGFRTAHHYLAGLSYIRIFTFIFCGLFVSAWLVLKKFSTSWKLTLISSSIIFGIVACIALFTNPTRSQDAYWYLLMSKMFVKYHFNPYQVTIFQIPSDSWVQYVVDWKWLTMISGPLSVWLYAIPSFFTESLGRALLIFKLEALAFLSVSYLLFWRILGLRKVDSERKAFLTTLFILNPFVFQFVLIDAHNDIFVMSAILFGYYLFQKREYLLSAFSLILGALVKYYSGLLVIIPLLAIARKKGMETNKKAFFISSLLILSSAVIFALCLPFGFNGDYLKGLKMLANIGSAETSTIFSFMLARFSIFSYSSLRIFGIVGAFFITLLFSWKKKYFLAFSLPLAFALSFGFPVLYPWYFLWVYPFILMTLPEDLIIVFTLLLLLLTDVMWPINVSIIALLYIYFRFFGKDVLTRPKNYFMNFMKAR